jgi:hypothetical protein
MTNTKLDQLLEGQPPAVEAEILRINEEARPIALQIALRVPLVAAGRSSSLRCSSQVCGPSRTIPEASPRWCRHVVFWLAHVYACGPEGVRDPLSY